MTTTQDIRDVVVAELTYDPDEAMPRLDALDRTGGTSNAIET
jgi:hypothetical protein